jgi:hypothetical protein
MSLIRATMQKLGLGCRPEGALCRKDSECCSGACVKDGTGRGRCAPPPPPALR